jgi:Na+-transporting NADH:ubiquinone oxidoreductase subunit NqrF
LLIIFFVGYEYIQPTYNEYLSTNTQLTDINLDVDNFGNKKLQHEADKKLITTIDQQSNQVISCLNYQQSCNQIEDVIKNNFGTVRSYIQL